MDVLLENLPVRRATLPVDSPVVGNCKAIETTAGDLDACTRSNLAPDESPDNRMVRERSKVLLLCLLASKRTVDPKRLETCKPTSDCTAQDPD